VPATCSRPPGGGRFGAATTPRPYRLDTHLELDLLAATWEPSQEAAVATQVAERAAAAGDELGELVMRVVAAGGRFEAREGSANELDGLARSALPRLEAVADHRALIAVWLALATLAIARLRFEDMAHACEEAMHHARLAGVYPGHAFGLPAALLWGPRPAGEAAEDLVMKTQDRPFPALYRAVLIAMLDRLGEARSLAESAGKRMTEIGRGEETSLYLALLAEIAGDYEQAAAQMGSFCGHLERLGRNAELSTFAPWLARYLCALGRYDEAEPLARKGRDLGDTNDNATQVLWRQAQALVDIHRGRHADAERVAREAVALDRAGDSLWQEGNSHCVLAEVLEAAGRRDEAVAAWQDALDCYDRKQVLPVARRLRERLAALEPA
jgi:tetratricopeptide (TPR) repeat protein